MTFGFLYCINTIIIVYLATCLSKRTTSTKTLSLFFITTCFLSTRKKEVERWWPLGDASFGTRFPAIFLLPGSGFQSSVCWQLMLRFVWSDTSSNPSGPTVTWLNTSGKHLAVDQASFWLQGWLPDPKLESHGASGGIDSLAEDGILYSNSSVSENGSLLFHLDN